MHGTSRSPTYNERCIRRRRKKSTQVKATTCVHDWVTCKGRWGYRWWYGGLQCVCKWEQNNMACKKSRALNVIGLRQMYVRTKTSVDVVLLLPERRKSWRHSCTLLDLSGWMHVLMWLTSLFDHVQFNRCNNLRLILYWIALMIAMLMATYNAPSRRRNYRGKRRRSTQQRWAEQPRDRVVQSIDMGMEGVGKMLATCATCWNGQGRGYRFNEVSRTRTRMHVVHNSHQACCAFPYAFSSISCSSLSTTKKITLTSTTVWFPHRFASLPSWYCWRRVERCPVTLTSDPVVACWTVSTKPLRYCIDACARAWLVHIDPSILIPFLLSGRKGTTMGVEHKNILNLNATLLESYILYILCIVS